MVIMIAIFLLPMEWERLIVSLGEMLHRSSRAFEGPKATRVGNMQAIDYEILDAGGVCH